MAHRVRVIGCGNPDAGDDALGLVVVDDLRGAVDADVVAAGPAARVLDLLGDVDTVIVVDAVRSPERPPGSLVRAEGLEELSTSLRGALSSHGLGLVEAVALAAALGPTPRIVFHGVAAGDVSMGAPLSDPVRMALPTLEAGVRADIAQEAAP
jgi:hydrogenase maturation protease